MVGTLIVFGLNRWVKRDDDRNFKATQIEAEERTQRATLDEEIRKAALEIVAWDIALRNQAANTSSDELTRPPPKEIATLGSLGSARLKSAIAAEGRLWSSSLARHKEAIEFIDQLVDVRAELVDAATQEVANASKAVTNR
jgi:hypothetical protein